MIRAIHFSDRKEFKRKRLKGSTHFDLINQALWFFCPCGCDKLVRIRVGVNIEPEERLCWSWNGNLNNPTLTPSFNRIDCNWHGWLKLGYWEEA